MSGQSERRRPAPWNARSARWNPLVVFIVCVVLVVLSCQRQRWLYVFPTAILGINSGLSFVFWTFRLSRNRGDSWRSVVISIGSVSRVFGLVSLLALVAMFAVLVMTPRWVTEYVDGPTAKFWLLWGWAVLELIHSHVYKLTLGSRDTLEYVLHGRRWTEAGRPLGGAIGQQLEKLRRQRLPHDKNTKGCLTR
jgi:hypothetical protein